MRFFLAVSYTHLLAKLGGNTVGVVASEEKTADGKACEKAARLVRFCDAFAIPVITFVNAESFCCIKAACKLTNAYAEEMCIRDRCSTAAGCIR